MREKETREFLSEVKQLLHLMIHSLYSNKEIFLRELISNASDAADRLRFNALSKPDLYEGDSKLRVRLSYNKEKRTITISDNGIGMYRQEVIENLGMIAKSGTKDFIKSISFDKLKNNQMIGQFGVGFYSAFIVSDKVTVFTRAAGANINEGVFWESIGEGDYTIADISKKERGTEIILHLRNDEDEFLNAWKLKNIIKKYSDYISLPIEMNQTKDDEKNTEWKQINSAKALWTFNKSDISDEEYKEFYKYLSNDSNDPLTWSHNRVEGKQEYTSLLYIPSKAPWDMWKREWKYGLKLYVQRVFIMDDAKQFIPNYLRFIKGLIDSNDLPLNISREILQDSYIVKNIKNTITKRILILLEKLSKENNEQYQLFWKQFGLVLKEGPGEDYINIKLIIKLLRFSSTYNDNEEQTITLEDYVKRMVEGQEKIYYITSDSYSSAKNSPHIELLRKKNIEVLLLSDRIDEWMMNYLTEFNGKTFQSVSKTDHSLEKFFDQDNIDKKNIEKEFESFIVRIKNSLGNRVKNVRLTNRLTNTPTVVTTDSNDMTTQMVKLFAASGQNAPEIKYIFELNPKHEIIKKIANIKEEDLFKEWIELLLDQALLAECGTLEDPNQFIQRINHLLSI